MSGHALNHQGWSRPLKDSQANTVLDASVFDWEQGVQLIDTENHWRARLKALPQEFFCRARLKVYRIILKVTAWREELNF